MCLLRGTDWIFIYNSGYVFCVDLRTNSDYFPVQHWLTGFHNLDRLCSLWGINKILCRGKWITSFWERRTFSNSYVLLWTGSRRMSVCGQSGQQINRSLDTILCQYTLLPAAPRRLEGMRTRDQAYLTPIMYTTPADLRYKKSAAVSTQHQYLHKTDTTTPQHVQAGEYLYTVFSNILFKISY